MGIFKFLDIFFVVFHTILILFNLFGWVWKRTRRANLITLGLTGLSWFALGIFYGIGYCPLTDWHWNVLAKLGKTDLPNSYIAYLLNRSAGISMSEKLVDIFTMLFFIVALLLSVFLNIRDGIKSKK